MFRTLLTGLLAWGLIGLATSCGSQPTFVESGVPR
ncbi:MAG: hypothetical protein ACI9WU_003980, partial [Myxococcota bacterium]